MSGKASTKSETIEEIFNEVKTTELMSHLFQVMFGQVMDDKEKEETLKDLLMDANKVKKRNVDRLRALYNRQV